MKTIEPKCLMHNEEYWKSRSENLKKQNANKLFYIDGDPWSWQRLSSWHRLARLFVDLAAQRHWEQSHWWSFLFCLLVFGCIVWPTIRQPYWNKSQSQLRVPRNFQVSIETPDTWYLMMRHVFMAPSKIVMVTILL